MANNYIGDFGKLLTPLTPLEVHIIKVYFRCKTITSQNVPSETQFNNFFVSQSNYVPFSRYSSFCIFTHLMIYQIYDVMISISTWKRVHFWIYLNSLTHQSLSIDRYKQGQSFSEIFWTIWRTAVKFQTIFNLATCFSYSITNSVKFTVFNFFERVNKGEL